MAELVTVEGQEYKKRSPWGVWGLTLITLGIFGYFWWYKINDEARRYLGDESIKPGLAVLALIPGAILIVPLFVTLWRTGERITRMEQKAGVGSQLEPILGVVAYLVLSLHIVYYQSHLNKMWDAAMTGAGTAPKTASPAGPPPVPPPPSSMP